MKELLGIIFAAILIAATAAWAGPPFVTDDPEPVEFRNGEFYVSSQFAHTRGGNEASIPLVEFNYGVVPEVQLHLLIPFAYNHSTGEHSRYGLGDTELGVKYRFLRETETVPQIGTFPLLEVPTGNSNRGLGGGEVRAFLPLWLLKAWGPWILNGGGGYWINPGSGNRNFWQFGLLGEREITKSLELGAELLYFGRDTADGQDRTSYNIGGIYNLNDNHHLLFSAGSDIVGDNRLFIYVGYQLTFGPHQDQGEKETH